MTDERMALLELIAKGADADLVRELLAYASERLMAAEVDRLTGAAAGGRGARTGSTIAMDIANAGGRRASAGSSSRSRS